VTGSGLIVETLAWLLVFAAAFAFAAGQGKLAAGLGLPALVLGGTEWLLPVLPGVGSASAQSASPTPPAPTTSTQAGAGSGDGFRSILVAALLLVALLAVVSGLWIARTMQRRATTRGRDADAAYPDSAYPGPAYLDLPGGQASPGEVERRLGPSRPLERLEPLGRWDGPQWERLGYRLSDLTRDFLSHVVPRPERKPKIDIRDPGVAWVIDGLLGAGDLMVAASGDDEPCVLAAAIREAERRWRIVRSRSSGPPVNAAGPDGDGDCPDRPGKSPFDRSTT
jgi:hypothetical protein